MQNILVLETKKYAIKTENFEGPLDLLCHLIDKNKMNINDIKISNITDQYLEYIKQMEEMNLDITSEFLVMASTLLYLKSKSLLPKQESEEEELTEEELIRRIIEYKKYKEITNKLKENFQIFSNRFFKVAEEIELPKQKIEKDYDQTIIPETYSKLIKRNEEKINEHAKNIEKIAIVETYTVASKVKDMFKELVKNKRFVFNKLFSIKQHNKQEVVTAFSGLLEMSRRSKITTTQEDTFGDIVVEKAKRNVV
jgi:segregation and condensation protein A